MARRFAEQAEQRPRQRDRKHGASQAVAKRFSKYVDFKDLVVWAHDYERVNEAEFQAKYGTPKRKPRAAPPKSALSLKDTALAAREEERRLQSLESQLAQQLESVRREKKDVAERWGSWSGREGRRRRSEVAIASRYNHPSTTSPWPVDATGTRKTSHAHRLASEFRSPFTLPR